MSTRPLPRLASLLTAATVFAAVCLPPSAALAQAGAATGAAAVDTSGPRWNDLSPAQRGVLAPLSNDWNAIDSRGKERWLGIAGRFHKMPTEEQQRAKQRMGEWSRMTPAQRTQARMNFQETRDVSKEERDARWKAYQALPDDKKRELATRAATPATAAPVVQADGRRRATTPLEDVQPKTNVLDPVVAPRTPLDPGSTVLRTHPGATTTLMTKRGQQPAHQRDGQPKISAGPGYVDRTTLLPKRGPQAAGGADKPAKPPRP